METPRYGNVRAVRITLECILVLYDNYNGIYSLQTIWLPSLWPSNTGIKPLFYSQLVRKNVLTSKNK